MMTFGGLVLTLTRKGGVCNLAFTLPHTQIAGVNGDLTPTQMRDLAQYIVDAAVPPQPQS